MNTKKKIITIIIGIEAVIIAAIIVFLFYINSDTVKVNRQLELAQRYLLEEDYEQAIAAFEIIIEIDPKNADAYLGLAEAYAATDDLENAVKILERASKRTDSEEILEMLEKHTAEIEQKELAAQKAAQRAAEAAQAAALAAAASSTVETAPAPQQDNAAETYTSEPEAALRGFIVQDGELYYYDETGNYVTGWFDKNNNRYCARADGRLYKGGEHQIDSKKYLFDQGGVCLGEIKEDEWKQAYIDHLHSCDMVGSNEGYTLIYVDNDNVPELVEVGKYEMLGCRIINYSNGTVHETQLSRQYFTYIERENLLCNSEGLMDGYYDNVYSIINGEMTMIASGQYGAEDNSNIQYDAYGNPIYYYEWEGKRMTEAEYDTEFRKVYNYDKAVDGYQYGNIYTYEQILDVIADF